MLTLSFKKEIIGAFDNSCSQGGTIQADHFEKTLKLKLETDPV